MKKISNAIWGAVVVLLGAIHVGYIFIKAHRVVAQGGKLVDVSRGKRGDDNKE